MPRIIVAALALIILCPPAFAAPSVTGPDGKLDASVRRLIDLRARGERAWHPRAAERLVPVDTVAAVIRLSVPATPGILARLEAAGARLFRAEGRPLAMGPFVQVRLPLDAVAAVAALPEVLKIEAHAPVRPAGWDDHTHTGTGLEQAWDLVETDTGDLLGEGTTVGLIDSWIDSFHPAFFHADGGRYDWLDLDGDGLFTPGVDGVDLDDDGTAGDAELLQVMNGPVTWTAHTTGTGVDENVADGYDPDQDWLWVDINLSGLREVGTGVGFVESTPAYGEPLFVGDDVDGSGTLDPGEKLLRLGSSKIKAIYRPEKDETFTRGENLIDYPAWGASISHATMTAGVVVGNLPVVQRRHGVAPSADILLVDWEMDQIGGEEVPYGDPILAGLVWLVENHANVTSHSYGILLGEFCDGSSELEQSMDYVFENSGVPACVSSGNEGAYPYHGSATIPAGELVEIPVTVGLGEWGTFMMQINLRWQDALEPFIFALEDPEGNQVELSSVESDGVPMGDDAVVRSFGIATSDRGTSVLSGRVRNPAGSWHNPAILPAGDYKLLVLNEADGDRVLDVIMADIYTGDSVELPDHFSPLYTITWPSTGDTAFSVGASVSNEGAVADLDNEGTLAGYSSRGPRIDGELALDVVAPCDLAAPWKGYHEKYFDEMGAPPEYYEMLDPYYPMYHSASGTSGAAPFAAGVMALWLQANPEGDPRDLPELVKASATADEITGEVPNPTWGYGKINASKLLTGVDPTPNNDPVVTVVAPAEVRLGEPFEVALTPSDVEDATEVLTVRWDLGYDGSWDLPYAEDMRLDVEGVEEPGLWRVVVQVRDSLGGTVRALVQVTVLDEPFVPVVEEEGGEDVVPSEDAVPAVDTDPGTPPAVDVTHSNGCTAGASAAAPWMLLLVGLVFVLRRRVRA
ncbi:MAG: S8 family serine peptidase [Pseudomonadota bacterium]